MKKIIIVGGAGYLGYNLCQFYKKIYKVILIDNFLTSVVEKKIIKDLKVYDVDVADYDVLKKIFKNNKPDIVIHSAASYSDSNNWKRDLSTNTLGTINLIKLCEQFGIEKFIYFQTSNCYGKTTLKKLHESLPYNPNSSYAISKSSAEQYLTVSKLPFVSLRLGIVYGPWHFSGPIPKFYHNLKKNKKSIIVNSFRQFLYMDDFLTLINKILNQNVKKENILNVSSDELVSIKDLYSKIKKIIKPTKDFYEIKKSVENDIKSVPLDIKSVNQVYNWYPLIKINKGLKKQIQWYEENDIGKSYSHLKIS
tara:strand:+ start:1442 stop:2365 length:924 start_codon:yes stop_codon:yes gene_type:complete